MMLAKQLKELWEMRFLRILDGEREAFHFYRMLLKRNQELLAEIRAQSVLEKMMRDELKHTRIALELVRLVKEKKIKTDRPGAKRGAEEGGSVKQEDRRIASAGHHETVRH